MMYHQLTCQRSMCIYSRHVLIHSEFKVAFNFHADGIYNVNAMLGPVKECISGSVAGGRTNKKYQEHSTKIEWYYKDIGLVHLTTKRSHYCPLMHFSVPPLQVYPTPTVYPKRRRHRTQKIKRNYRGAGNDLETLRAHSQGSQWGSIRRAY